MFFSYVKTFVSHYSHFLIFAVRKEIQALANVHPNETGRELNMSLLCL